MTTTTDHRTAPAIDSADQPVLRLRDVSELLAYLPHRLGFHPGGSLVAAGIGGARRTLGLVARMDLADLVAPLGPFLARDLVRHLLADGADEVLVAAYTPEDPREPDADGRLRPRAGSPAVLALDRFALAWEARLPAARIERWVVTEVGYLDLDCADAGCCPLGGRTLDDVSSGPLARRLERTRPPVAPDRDALGRIEQAAPGPRRSADSARLRWADRLRRARRADSAPVHDGGGAGDGRARRADSAPVHDGAGAGDGAPADDDAGTAGGTGEARGATGEVRGAAGEARAAAAGRRAAAGVPWQDAAERRWRHDSLALWTAALAEAAEGATGGSDSAAATGAASGAGPAGSPVDGPDDAQPTPRSGRGPAPRVLGRIEAALADRVTRDAILLTILDPGSDLPHRVLDRDRHGHDAGGEPVGQQIGAALDALLPGPGARRPDLTVTRGAVLVLEQVVAHGRVGRQAPALTLLAMIAWWSGDGPLASVHVERALRADAQHGLALLVGRLLDSCAPPGWVHDRR